MRMSISQFLEDADCSVIAAASGEAALAVLQKHDAIDVVFTDIRLGGHVNGWDVGEAFRAAYPEKPVIYASAAVVVPERRVGGSIFIEKPYDPAAVLAACQILHNARNASRSL